MEGGFVCAGQRQEVVHHRKEFFNWTRFISRLRYLFLVLVSVVVLLIFCLNLSDSVPDSTFKAWMQQKPTKWRIEVHDETRSTSSPDTSPGKYLVEYPHEYHFIIDQPKVCEEQKPFLVLMVPVAPHNRADRDTIRATWGGERWVLGKEVMLFFMLGVTSGDGSGDLREEILQESREHRDLIQSDFLDCYKNLTIKTMMILEWLDSHCSGASFAMKIDSDMFLNVPRLVQMLLSAPRKNYLTGLVASGAEVLRDPDSKWYLPYDVYPHSYYPLYALGLGYVLSMDLPKKLVEASRHVQAVYIEDVYLGLCMQHLGISPTFPRFYRAFRVSPTPYNRCIFSRLIATTLYDYADRRWIWRDFKRPRPYCFRSSRSLRY